MSLKQDILTAYGTCDYLSAYNGLDMRYELSKELISLYCLLHPDDFDGAKAFSDEYLLADPSVRDEILTHLDLEKFERQSSVLYSDFEWVDSMFAAQDASYSGSNQKLLKRIFDQMAEKDDRGEAFLSNLKTIDEMDAYLEKENDPLKEENLDRILKELNELTGLKQVKKDVEQLTALIKVIRIRESLDLKTPAISRHLVFTGNPGTGKTTVARLIAKIYKELGVLKNGQMVECDRSSLVAGYIGQTAIKTKEMIDKAMGGVLFIDEAYSLARESPNDFGQEAIETLLKAMEDHRDNLVVIAAGYEKPMEDFLQSNPGLKSRFNRFINFENYTAGQLVKIMDSMAANQDYEIDEDARKILHDQFEQVLENPPKDFANARFARNILEFAISNQAVRILSLEDPTKEQVKMLIPEDFAALQF